MSRVLDVSSPTQYSPSLSEEKGAEHRCRLSTSSCNNTRLIEPADRRKANGKLTNKDARCIRWHGDRAPAHCGRLRRAITCLAMLEAAVGPLLEALSTRRTDILKTILEEVREEIKRDHQDAEEAGMCANVVIDLL